jgi:TatA/E family protein of Tat protein translocase
MQRLRRFQSEVRSSREELRNAFAPKRQRPRSQVSRKRPRRKLADVHGLASPWHLLLLFLAIVFFFGAKRLPEIGRNLGEGMREFKQSGTAE